MRGGLLPLLAGAAAILLTGVVSAQDSERWWSMPFRSFTLQSESMEPTIRPISYLLAMKRAPATVVRGDLIAFRVDDRIWVKRVVGLPGDRVAMVDGQVVLNGHAIDCVAVEPYLLASRTSEPSKVARCEERLPGEAVAHMVLDVTRMPWDNVPVTTVKPGHFYVLGDNRDNSVDSRMSSKEIPGAGLVAFGDVYGLVSSKSIRWLGAPEARRLSNDASIIVPAEPGPRP